MKPKKLPSQKTLRKYFDYSPEGFFIRKIGRGNLFKAGSKVTGTIKMKNNMQVKFFGELYMYHRLIWAWHFKNVPDVIDHININALDNRIENLRAASIAKNAYNRKRRPKGSSNFKGVFWSKEHKKWRAAISAENKKFHLGLFSTQEGAAIAYRKAAKEKHGRFANYD